MGLISENSKISGSSGVPFIYDLYVDPNESELINSQCYLNDWIRFPAGQLMVEHLKSLKTELPIRPGIPHPYAYN